MTTQPHLHSELYVVALSWAAQLHRYQRRNGKPLQMRTEHLATLSSPTQTLQGERDGFGRRVEVETYSLSPHVQLRWIPSGDHILKPTRSSGFIEAENLATAVALGDQCLREVLSD